MEGPDDRLPDGADRDGPDDREDMPDEREDILDCEDPLDELERDILGPDPERPPECPPDPPERPPPPLPKTDITGRKNTASAMIKKTKCLNPFVPILFPLTYNKYYTFGAGKSNKNRDTNMQNDGKSLIHEKGEKESVYRLPCFWLDLPMSGPKSHDPPRNHRPKGDWLDLP